MAPVLHSRLDGRSLQVGQFRTLVDPVRPNEVGQVEQILTNRIRCEVGTRFVERRHPDREVAPVAPQVEHLLEEVVEGVPSGLLELLREFLDEIVQAGRETAGLDRSGVVPSLRLRGLIHGG